MKYYQIYRYVKFIFLSTFFLSQCGTDTSVYQLPDYKSGEVIVLIDVSKVPASNDSNHPQPAEFQLGVQKTSAVQTSLYKLISASGMPEFRYNDLLWKTPTEKSQPIISKITLPEGVDVQVAIAKLKKLDYIMSAEPNYLNTFQDIEPDVENSNIISPETSFEETSTTPAATPTNTASTTTSSGHHYDEKQTYYLPTEKGFLDEQKFLFDMLQIPQAWTYIFSRWPTDTTTSSTPATTTPSTSTTGASTAANPAVTNPIHTTYVGVAVLDSGVAAYHPELKNKIFTNVSEMVGKAGEDDDGNGYVDDISGVNVNEGDFAKTSNDENECNGQQVKASLFFGGTSTKWTEEKKQACYQTVGHGTHVSGIIAANIDDGKEGMAGICPNCYILPIKIIDRSGEIPDSNIIRGVDYIAGINSMGSAHQIQIANLSIGKMISSAAIENAIRRISDYVLFVAAASNDDTEQPAYPAAMPEVLSVAALGGFSVKTAGDAQKIDTKEARTIYEQKAVFSNFGNHIDIAAPGVYVWSLGAYEFKPTDVEVALECAQGNQYCYKSGTSQAAPFVAGVAGLVWSFWFKSLEDNSLKAKLDTNSPDWVKIILMRSADARIYKSGYNYMYGGASDKKAGAEPVAGKQLLGTGIVDALRALNYERIYENDIPDLHLDAVVEKSKFDSSSGCPIIVSIDKIDKKPPKPPFGGSMALSIFVITLVMWFRMRKQYQ